MQNGLFGRQAVEQLDEFAPQFVGRAEEAVFAEVAPEKAVARAGDVAADRVDGLVFAAEAVRAARVDDAALKVAEVGQHFGGVDRPAVARRTDEVDRRDDRHHRVERPAFLDPLPEAAVE